MHSLCLYIVFIKATFLQIYMNVSQFAKADYFYIMGLYLYLLIVIILQKSL